MFKKTVHAGNVIFALQNLSKEKKVTAETVSQCEKAQGTPYYNDDVVLKQEQELELKENVAYAPV